MPCRSFGGMGKITTLHNSYCVPTDSEWEEYFDHINNGKEYVYANTINRMAYSHHCIESANDIQVSVPRYLDLLHDRIVPWRLEEAGFVPFPDEHNTAMMRWENDAQYTVEVIGGGVYVNNASYNITTFTELLTLIKFLTPPTK